MREGMEERGTGVSVVKAEDPYSEKKKKKRRKDPSSLLSCKIVKIEEVDEISEMSSFLTLFLLEEPTWSWWGCRWRFSTEFVFLVRRKEKKKVESKNREHARHVFVCKTCTPVFPRPQPSETRTSARHQATSSVASGSRGGDAASPITQDACCFFFF